MEENKPEIVDVDFIPRDITVNVELNSNIHVRLQQLLLEGLPIKDKEHLDKCLKQIADEKVEDPVAYHMQTILHIIEKFEYSVYKEKMMMTKKFSFAENKFLDDEPAK